MPEPQQTPVTYQITYINPVGTKTTATAAGVSGWHIADGCLVLTSPAGDTIVPLTNLVLAQPAPTA